MQSSTRPRRLLEQAMFCLLRFAATINVLALLGVCLFLVWNGLPAITWEFLTEPPRQSMTAGGIWPCLVGTVLLAAGALCIAFPLGVASAVYLHEYAGRSPLAGYIRLGVNNLAGVPSIVFGLFGMSFFVIACGFGICLLSGVLTLAVLILPIIIGTAEEALRQVPGTYREASLALGATQSQTIVRVVLPAAMPGMLTGAILGLSRAAGETAVIMFTAAVFFHEEISRLAVQPGHGSAEPHLRAGNVRHEHRQNHAFAIRHGARADRPGARHEPDGHHPAGQAPDPLIVVCRNNRDARARVG